MKAHVIPEAENIQMTALRNLLEVKKIVRNEWRVPEKSRLI
jgi:hypothetical protein